MYQAGSFLVQFHVIQQEIRSVAVPVFQALANVEGHLQLVSSVEIILCWKDANRLRNFPDRNSDNGLTDFNVRWDRVHKFQFEWS